MFVIDISWGFTTSYKYVWWSIKATRCHQIKKGLHSIILWKNFQKFLQNFTQIGLSIPIDASYTSFFKFFFKLKYYSNRTFRYPCSGGGGWNRLYVCTELRGTLVHSPEPLDRLLIWWILTSIITRARYVPCLGTYLYL